MPSRSDPGTHARRNKALPTSPSPLSSRSPISLRRKLWTPLVTAAAAAAIVAALLHQFGGPAALHPQATSEPLRCESASLPQGSTPSPGMVWIPPGEFAYGDTVYPEEQPVRMQRVKGFWMDRTEVTNGQFAAFVAATGYVTVAERALSATAHPGLPPEMLRPGAVVFISPTALGRGGDPSQWWQYVPGAQWRHPQGPNSSIEAREHFPVVAVTLEDALAYARWAGRDLPTEVEWEWAARGGGNADTAAVANPAPARDTTQAPAQANTWQGMFPVQNTLQDGFAGVAPVGCFAPNGFGLLDMIGNIWEITADAYTEDHRLVVQAPDQLPPAARKEVRSGTPAGVAGNAPPGIGSGAGSGAASVADLGHVSVASAGASAAHQLPARVVIKGGSYLCAPNYCMRYRAGARQPQETDLASSHIGFRTILRAASPT